MGPARDLLAEPGDPVQDPFGGEARFPRQEGRAGGPRPVGGLPQVDGLGFQVKERRKVAEGAAEVPFGSSRDGEGDPPLLAEVPEQRRDASMGRPPKGGPFAPPMAPAARAAAITMASPSSEAALKPRPMKFTGSNAQPRRCGFPGVRLFTIGREVVDSGLGPGP